MLDYTKSFIETQFPVSKISKESYKERKAVQGQTLTGLGKWWGRKPLILVRASLLGLLLPVSDNLIRDKEIFLKILTMDDAGLWFRKNKLISIVDIYSLLNKIEQIKYFKDSSTSEHPYYLDSISKNDKTFLQQLSFNRLSYDDKLFYCERPENVNLTDVAYWDEINKHLEINAFSLKEVIQQLGVKRYGHLPMIGDCFSGGGSIPFEAARIGANVYASDLNPVASLLTWASINIGGAQKDELNNLRRFQSEVYVAVDKQISQWGIEHNEKGHRADAYLYCLESVCPECGYKIPLSPSWTIGRGSNTVAVLKENIHNGFDIEVKMDATDSQHEESKKSITVRQGKMYCPHCKKETPISSIRRDKISINSADSGLRLWEQNEFIARPDDIFQERLYAIRYIGDNGRYYVTPTEEDFIREQKVISLLTDNFDDWQRKGYIPSSKLEPGEKTDEPIRTRGWQYWHQLFNPRQLIVNGLFAKNIFELAKSRNEYVVGLLGLNTISDWNSKLCRWGVGQARESFAQTFYNQALNTIYNNGSRGLTLLQNNWKVALNSSNIDSLSTTKLDDARNISCDADIWITDPPYADAVNYHELTEFFLAWDGALIKKAFPEWYTDSKRILAVKGVGKSFNDSMIEIYKNLSNHMTENGTQIVMFTHQDVKVWSELAMILWSAGLRVVSAWNVGTETDASGLKSGNYVKGTVLLTLKKQTSNQMAFQDELYDEIKHEVKSIIDSMRNLDDRDDPDFKDEDYLLSSYAATLKVLTSYKNIEDIDVQFWLNQSRANKEQNPIELLINKAVRVAYDYLIPDNFEKTQWADLKPDERFYIRGLELEMNGSYKISSYQELARGFGVVDYKELFAEFKANSARLKTPNEYKMSYLNGKGFASSLTRHLFVAIYETTKSKSTVEGRSYLRNVFRENNEYWYKKPLMTEILTFIANLEYVGHMEHWKEPAYYAKLLRESLKNEGV